MAAFGGVLSLPNMRALGRADKMSRQLTEYCGRPTHLTGNGLALHWMEADGPTGRTNPAIPRLGRVYLHRASQADACSGLQCDVHGGAGDGSDRSPIRLKMNSIRS